MAVPTFLRRRLKQVPASQHDIMTVRLLGLFVISVGASVMLAQKQTCPATSHISIASGTFSSQPGVSFQLKNFDAMLVPVGKTAPTCYDKMTVVSHAEIFVTNESLSNIFSKKLQATESKIKDFKVENGLSGVTLSGKMARIIPLLFTIEGPVTTNGTQIRLDARKIKADGIPVKELLHLVGAELSSFLQLKGMSGITIEDNALSFSPELIAHLKGHIASVTTSEHGLTLRYTSPKQSSSHRKSGSEPQPPPS